MSAPLEISGVTFAYRREPVLVDLSLSIGEGESIAILGPNGTGKTTLVRVACGALRPARGEVRLFGDAVGSLNPRERARRVAVVPQDTHPAFDFRVREMVMLGRAPHQGILGRARREDLDAVQEAIERCDLAALADRDLGALSGGERQRVALARALGKVKVSWVVIFQHVHTVTDCLDVCKFATFANSMDTFAAQFAQSPEGKQTRVIY